MLCEYVHSTYSIHIFDISYSTPVYAHSTYYIHIFVYNGVEYYHIHIFDITYSTPYYLHIFDISYATPIYVHSTYYIHIFDITFIVHIIYIYLISPTSTPVGMGTCSPSRLMDLLDIYRYRYMYDPI